jgi:hypothetical protein
MVHGVGFAALTVSMPAAVSAEFACTEGAPLATPLQLDYVVTATRSILSLRGDGTISYRRDGDKYRMESTLQAFGIFEAHQSSVGTVKPSGLVPRSFGQTSTRRPLRKVTFDWSAQRVTFSENGESVPTRPQMQDRLSLLMQLAWRHRKDLRTRSIEMPVAGLRHAPDYVFSARETAPVVVPAGRFEAVKFEREKDDPGDDTLEVWLAPDLCSLPVRVRFADDKGLVIDQQLRAVQPL